MEKFKVDKIFDTYEEMLASDEINSVAIFSQRNQHGQMAIQALKHGKNVYSAVPMATDIEEIKENTEITRTATNELINWVDYNFRDEYPFPVDKKEAI